MALFDLLSTARVPKDLVGKNLVIAEAIDLNGAEPFLQALEQTIGPLALGLLNNASYTGDRPCVALPKTRGADRKRIKRLRPKRLIAIGRADERFSLIRAQNTPKYWINAQHPETADTGCQQIYVSDAQQKAQIPGAQLSGDPLLGLQSLPPSPEKTTLCERFKEFREREQWVIYAAATGIDEEALGYGLLFELLRKKTAVMILSPRDPARYEPVYRDAIKYSLPTIRHNRLITSYVPNKNRVYYVEDPQTLHSMYACADIVLAGGTLHPSAQDKPDLITPIQAGVPILVGPRHDDPWVQAALRAQIVMSGQDSTDLGECARTLLENPDQHKDLLSRAQQWLTAQVGAQEKILQGLG